jgi:hypothetical protein
MNGRLISVREITFNIKKEKTKIVCQKQFVALLDRFFLCAVGIENVHIVCRNVQHHRIVLYSILRMREVPFVIIIIQEHNFINFVRDVRISNRIWMLHSSGGRYLHNHNENFIASCSLRIVSFRLYPLTLPRFQFHFSSLIQFCCASAWICIFLIKMKIFIWDRRIITDGENFSFMWAAGRIHSVCVWVSVGVRNLMWIKICCFYFFKKLDIDSKIFKAL